MGGSMRVAHLGQVITLPAASELPWPVVYGAATSLWKFAAYVWPAEIRLPYVWLKVIHAAWMRHNGVPEAGQTQRLVYMMQKYSKGIEYDLRGHLGVSAGELWRGRRWRELLNYIDMLPQNSHMNRLLTKDEEYMEKLMERGGTSGSGRPSMAEWSLTNSLLAQLIDAVHVNTAVNRGIANPKGPKPSIDPVPRPETVAEKIRHRIEQRRHQEMVAMLLPSKAKGEGKVP